jgi:leucyl-tRNA synthetase
VLAGSVSLTGEVSLTDMRRFVVADAAARFYSADGDTVLLAAAFDRAAARDGAEVPREGSVAKRQEQLERFGLTFDWPRSSVTLGPEQRRWSQWLFLELLDAGLVYRQKRRVEWCPGCEIVLARSEVHDATCTHCGAAVELKRRSAWYLAVSAYNAENDERLDDMPAWGPLAAAAQRDLLGRMDGVELDALSLDGTTVTVFTEYPDAIAKAEYVALAPSHPDVEKWARWKAQTQPTEAPAGIWRHSAEDGEAAPLVETDLALQVPGVSQPLPVVLSGLFERKYGSAAVLGTPTADRDHAAVARRLCKPRATTWHPETRDARPRRTRRYRASDVPISRPPGQGVPIPVVRCSDCGSVALPVDALPFEAHDDSAQQISHPCPECGEAAAAEVAALTPAFDRLVDWLRLAAPETARESAGPDHAELRKWLPARQAVGGRGAAADVLAQRMVAKALRDRGALSFLTAGEPYEGYAVCGAIRGAEDVALGELVDRYGADGVRFALLYTAAPHKDVAWRTEDIEHCSRFLERVRTFAMSRLDELPSPAAADVADPLQRRLARWCSTAVERVRENLENVDLHRATRNVVTLFVRIEDFEARAFAARGGLNDSDRIAVANALVVLVDLLSPLAPALADELGGMTAQHAHHNLTNARCA